MRAPRLLFIYAHPDDESFAVAGISRMYADQGVEIALVTATRGDAGRAGEPPICSRGELPAVREAELRTAARLLGIGRVTVLDYLDKPAATSLATQIVRWLKPGGVVLCFFSTAANPAPVYTRYVITDTEHLRHRTSPAAHGRRTIYQNRDIERLFVGLGVIESFLLLNKTREVLLRKKQPAAPKSV